MASEQTHPQAPDPPKRIALSAPRTLEQVQMKILATSNEVKDFKLGPRPANISRDEFVRMEAAAKLVKSAELALNQTNPTTSRPRTTANAQSKDQSTAHNSDGRQASTNKVVKSADKSVPKASAASTTTVITTVTTTTSTPEPSNTKPKKKKKHSSNWYVMNALRTANFKENKAQEAANRKERQVEQQSSASVARTPMSISPTSAASKQGSVPSVTNASDTASSVHTSDNVPGRYLWKGSAYAGYANTLVSGVPRVSADSPRPNTPETLKFVDKNPEAAPLHDGMSSRANPANPAGLSMQARHATDPLQKLSLKRPAEPNEDNEATKKLRLNHTPQFEQSYSRQSSKESRTASARSMVSRASQDIGTIDLTQDPPDPTTGVPVEQCVNKLLGVTITKGRPDFRLNLYELHTLVQCVVAKYPYAGLISLHPMLTSTARMDRPSPVFSAADHLILPVSINHKIGVAMLSKSDKLAIYFCSDSVRKTLVERIDYIIGVNRETLGQSWGHVYQPVEQSVSLDDSGVWAIFHVECILRRAMFPGDIDTNAQTLRYRYAKLLSETSPEVPYEIYLSLQQYLMTEKDSLRIDLLENDFNWLERKLIHEDEPKDENSSQVLLDSVEQDEEISFVAETVRQSLPPPMFEPKAELRSQDLYDATPNVRGKKLRLSPTPHTRGTTPHGLFSDPQLAARSSDGGRSSTPNHHQRDRSSSLFPSTPRRRELSKSLAQNSPWARAHVVQPNTGNSNGTKQLVPIEARAVASEKSRTTSKTSDQPRSSVMGPPALPSSSAGSAPIRSSSLPVPPSPPSKSQPGAVSTGSSKHQTPPAVLPGYVQRDPPSLSQLKEIPSAQQSPLPRQSLIPKRGGQLPSSVVGNASQSKAGAPFDNSAIRPLPHGIPPPYIVPPPSILIDRPLPQVPHQISTMMREKPVKVVVTARRSPDSGRNKDDLTREAHKYNAAIARRLLETFETDVGEEHIISLYFKSRKANLPIPVAGTLHLRKGTDPKKMAGIWWSERPGKTLWLALANADALSISPAAWSDMYNANRGWRTIVCVEMSSTKKYDADLWLISNDRKSVFLIFELLDLANVLAGKTGTPQAMHFVKLLVEANDARQALTKNGTRGRNGDRDLQLAMALQGQVSCTKCKWEQFHTELGWAAYVKHYVKEHLHDGTEMKKVLCPAPGCVKMHPADFHKTAAFKSHLLVHMGTIGKREFYENSIPKTGEGKKDFQYVCEEARCNDSVRYHNSREAFRYHTMFAHQSAWDRSLPQEAPQLYQNKELRPLREVKKLELNLEDAYRALKDADIYDVDEFCEEIDTVVIKGSAHIPNTPSYPNDEESDGDSGISDDGSNDREEYNDIDLPEMPGFLSNSDAEQEPRPAGRTRTASRKAQHRQHSDEERSRMTSRANGLDDIQGGTRSGKTKTRNATYSIARNFTGMDGDNDSDHSDFSKAQPPRKYGRSGRGAKKARKA